MKRVSIALALAVFTAVCWIAIGRAQGNSDNPFWKHNTRGDLVHVLPPAALIHQASDKQEVFAPPSPTTAVYSASYGSGSLINHGGPQIPNAGFEAVYWNASAASGNTGDTSLGYADMQSYIDAFITKFSDGLNWDNSATDDYTVIQQYGKQNAIAASLRNWGYFVDSQPTLASISDTTIQSYLQSLFVAGSVQISSSIVYGVYFPPGMSVQLDSANASCTSFCGYHGNFAYNGMDIKYAAFPYLNCSGCLLTGKHVADMLSIVTGHEIREATTDPDLNAWFDRAGYEADDKCAWHNLYNLSNGGFLVQPEYSNGGTVTASGFTATYPGPGCIVPSATTGGGGRGHGR
jgi:hypothetical protein